MSRGDYIMEVETDNKYSAIEFDQEDKDMFQKIKEKNEPEKEKNRSDGQGQGSKPVTKIQRVPDVMKAEKNVCWEKYFTPEAIAIGPIHAHTKNLLLREELKLIWAAKYLDGLEHEKILQQIKGEIDSLMKNFDEKCLDKDAKDLHGTLARMLFVDGCAMLQFIYSFVWDDDFLKHLKINAAQADLVQQDLFLLENQIPFRVLQIIMNGGKNKQQKEINTYLELAKMETAIQIFIHQSNMSTGSRPEISLKFDGVVHLLDLLRRSILDDSAQSDGCSYAAFNCLRSFVKFSVFVIFKLPLYVLGFLVCLAAIIVVTLSYIIYRFIHFLKRSASPRRWYLESFCGDMIFLCIGGFRSPKSPITRCTFRNAQELKAAGIEMKPSKSWCLEEGGFSFGLFAGYLRLCPILVDKSTAGKLLNLIAYEMCPDYHCKITKDSESYDYRISSYLRFLDSLVDNEQDVKVLREANMVRHLLSSDKEVAELFNSIGPLSRVANDAYDNANFEREDYYKRKIRIWITECRREHLSSPWKLLALIAAAAALGLTAAQTYFATNPR